MNNLEREVFYDAIRFANSNKKKIAKRLVDKNKYVPEDYPISVFMAGSPGAGKTESSVVLIESLSGKDSVLRIDTDDLRKEFKSYNGTNSSLFQAGTSILADRIHDLALKNKQSFVFDGTFTNFEKSKENIERSISPKRNREVYIIYVYQDPVQAWNFVQKRAEKDGRVIPKEAFVAQYFQARENVNKIKDIFGGMVQVDLVVKNIDGTDFRYKENVISIDSYLKEKYSLGELNERIL